MVVVSVYGGGVETGHRGRRRREKKRRGSGYTPRVEKIASLR